MVTCSSCGSKNAAEAKFCSECGARLAPASRPIEERKIVTVVFCDLVGSTARAEQLDPEDVRGELSSYPARVRSELERALPFWRSVGAWRYLHRCETLLAAAS